MNQVSAGMPVRTVDALASATSLASLTHVLITHLDPKAIPTLERVLARATAAGARPQVILSNPAVRLLQATWGTGQEQRCVCHRSTLTVKSAT